MSYGFMRLCYRLCQMKPVLKHFCVRSAVLNEELPANLRAHIIKQFNRVRDLTHWVRSVT